MGPKLRPYQSVRGFPWDACSKTILKRFCSGDQTVRVPRIAVLRPSEIGPPLYKASPFASVSWRITAFSMAARLPTARRTCCPESSQRHARERREWQHLADCARVRKWDGDLIVSVLIHVLEYLALAVYLRVRPVATSSA